MKITIFLMFSFSLSQLFDTHFFFLANFLLILTIWLFFTADGPFTERLLRRWVRCKWSWRKKENFNLTFLPRRGFLPFSSSKSRGGGEQTYLIWKKRTEIESIKMFDVKQGWKTVMTTMTSDELKMRRIIKFDDDPVNNARCHWCTLTVLKFNLWKFW